MACGTAVQGYVQPLVSGTVTQRGRKRSGQNLHQGGAAAGGQPLRVLFVGWGSTPAVQQLLCVLSGVCRDSCHVGVIARAQAAVHCFFD